MEHEYDFWKSGVSEENIKALAEVTEDVSGRLDFFVEKYKEDEVQSERLEDIMHLGKRALEAEEKLMSTPVYEKEDYTDTEVFGEEVNQKAQELIEEQETDPEDEIDLDEEPKYSGNEGARKFLAYSDDYETHLRNAQEQYLSTLEKIRNLSDVEVIEPENSIKY